MSFTLHARAAAISALLLAMAGSTALAATDRAEPVGYNADIRPVLADKCFICHGRDEKRREAGLRLDLRESALKRDKHGRSAIVPSRPDKSKLVERILSRDADEMMPPPESHKTLDENEKNLLVKWIRQGAKYERHWSFLKPSRPTLPAVRNRTWVRNEIDPFILARLAARGLQPSPAARRHTLVRRVSLDLRGLPPSPDEVKAFIDDRANGAYERMVDRMLASPHFGEKMALHWMDLGRYGDTNGYHFDSTRQVWLWRDWVIRAYNENMPFDRFTVEQLAGDLLPNATIQQKVASGFNRNTRYNEEGGADEKEFRVRYAVDRTNTLGQVWLGLTVNCAECHDHKYDPFSQKEFYQLYAFFNSLNEPGAQGHNQKYGPLINVPPQLDKSVVKKANADIKGIERAIADAAARIKYAEPKKGQEDLLPKPIELVWLDDDLPGGVKAEGDGFKWVEKKNGPVHSGRRAMRRDAKGSKQHFFTNSPQKLRIGTGDRLFAWVHLDKKNPPRAIMLQFNSLGNQKGWLHRAYWGANLFKHGRDKSTERRRLGPLPTVNKWVRLEVDAAHIGLKPGMTVHGMAFTQYDGVAHWDTAGIVTRTKQGPTDRLWFTDSAPAGASLRESWNWVTHDGHRATKRSGGGLTQHYFDGARDRLVIRAGDVLFEYVWLDPKNPPKAIQMQFNDGSWEHRAYWGKNLCHGNRKEGPHNHHIGPLPETGKWVRLEVPARHVNLKPGAKVRGWAYTQFGGTVYYRGGGTRTWSDNDAREGKSLELWAVRAVNDKAVPEAVRKALKSPAAKRSPAQTRIIEKHYIAHVWTDTRKTFDPLKKKLAAVRKSLEVTGKNLPFQLVSVEMAKPRNAFVLMRGDFQKRGEQVQRDVPAIFPRLPQDKPRNRLGLAHWLMSPEHPLTSRVVTNRYWAQIFGRGLVETVGDLGTQGTPPTHPGLLDWLAVEYIENGWDTKAIFRKILLSATYRQSPVNDHRYDGADPANKLLWRSPRYRLMAEEVRDNALRIAGLLSEKIGGRPVFPFQPKDYYKGKKGGWKWNLSQGEDRYRRGMYTFWRRTTPYPAFVIFDAPDRAQCVVARARTNSPLQALTTLNGPQFVEAARVFGQRVLTEGPKDLDGRLGFAFRLAVTRPPSPDEMSALRDIHREQTAHYKTRAADAKALANAGDYARPDGLADVDLAVWTAMANTLLNLDETITRE